MVLIRKKARLNKFQKNEIGAKIEESARDGGGTEEAVICSIGKRQGAPPIMIFFCLPCDQLKT